MKNGIVIFLLDDQRYALFLSAIERIVRAVEVTPLPKAPEIVMGVINLGGRIVPVIDIRKRFRLREKEVSLSDQFLIARTSKRTVGLVADSVWGVAEPPPDQVTSVKEIVPGSEYVEGIVRRNDGMILIHDLDRFLSFEEEAAINEAMA